MFPRVQNTHSIDQRIIIAFMESGFMFSVGTGVLVVLGAINVSPFAEPP